MKWGIIGTWRMSLEGITEAGEYLEKDGDASEAIEMAIRAVEDYPFYKSVGYGGLPNENGEIELDAAYMDGKNFHVGCVAGVKNCKNPISIAKKLSGERFNVFLVGEGAEKYATLEGFEKQNMVTPRAKIIWEKRKKEIAEKNLSPYDGHDTVGMICLSKNGHMVSGTSTSGLFLKKQGRVGDSPVIGSGYYVDEEIGGATATGLGEDIMKGCLSYEVVRRMGLGVSVKTVAQEVIDEFEEKLTKRQGKAGAISIVCMDKEGNWGIGTNVEFSFVIATDQQGPQVYVADKKDGVMEMELASQDWLDAYTKRITSPV